jgi:hypothetical protein
MAPGPPSSSNDYLMNTRTSSASRPNTFASSSADPSSRPPRIPTRREGFEVALDGVLHSHVEGGEESDRLLQNEGEGGNERGTLSKGVRLPNLSILTGCCSLLPYREGSSRLGNVEGHELVLRLRVSFHAFALLSSPPDHTRAHALSVATD